MEEIAADVIGTKPVAHASDIEQNLATEITELWAVHVDTQSAVKKTQAELKVLRRNLGERLHAMKQLLARPGRAGQWSSFLEQHGISRTTADRLCVAHQKVLSPDGNGTTGAVPDLSDDEIAELAKATWKKLQKKLGDKRSAYAFLGSLVDESGLASFKFTRGDQRGLALVDPDADSAAQTTAATTDASAAVPTNAT